MTPLVVPCIYMMGLMNILVVNFAYMERNNENLVFPCNFILWKSGTFCFPCPNIMGINETFGH